MGYHAKSWYRQMSRMYRHSLKDPRVTYAAALGLGVAGVELFAYLCHTYQKSSLESLHAYPPDEDHDDAEHRRRIRTLLAVGTPDPRKFLQDMFVGCEVQDIPRSKAIHVLSAYLTYAKSDHFETNGYPSEVVRESEELLRTLELRMGVTLRDDTHDPISPHPQALFTRGPDTCLLGGPIHALHKPLTMRAAIYAMHKVKAAILFANGFRPRSLPEHRDVVVWVKPPTGGVAATAPPILFAHGFGMGLALYVPLIVRFAGPEFANRYVVCPEMPIVSQRDTLTEVFDLVGFARRHHDFPNPRGIASSLLAACRDVLAEQALAAPRVPHCVDLIAHSWGTGVSAALHRIAPKGFVRRRALIDPIAFPTAFTKWMRFFWGDELKSLQSALSWSLTQVREGRFQDAYQCLLVRTDLSHQFVVRRKTYFTELLFDPNGTELRNECPGDSSTLVLVSGKDAIVPSAEVEAYVRERMPGAVLISKGEWEHGGFLYASDAKETVDKVFAHLVCCDCDDKDDGNLGGGKKEHRYGVGGLVPVAAAAAA
ncbi:AB hydrolase-1 domain-containing protein [Pseudoscourfieldia marina]